jgi:hypothetical protein
MKYDDIYFKSIETLPPKFTSMQTLVNDSDSLVSLILAYFKTNFDCKSKNFLFNKFNLNF